MAVFSQNQIRVFDKAGLALGVLPTWVIEQPRSFRLNEIEDFGFSIPRNDLITGEVHLTADVCDRLLRRDNLIYLANRDRVMRGWAGSITKVTYTGGIAKVNVAGMLEKFYKLETERIEQDGGYVWTIAQRFVAAAQAKQVANGDMVIDFDHVETVGAERRNYGLFSYEGDILAGLQTLMTNTLSESYVHSRVGTDGNLHAKLVWGGRFHINRRDIIIKDGPGGSIKPGNEISFSSTDLVNHVRLRGTPTTLGEHVDYSSVRNVIQDVTPEAEINLDPGTHRQREELGLSVGFGFDTETQKAMAKQVQDLYLGYFKSFCYAYHTAYGKPYLEGFDWEGPDGRNDKKLTAHFYRSARMLGYIGKKTVIVGSTDDDDVSVIEAKFDDWQHEQDIVIDPVEATGICVDYSDPNQRFIADGATGNVMEMASDRATMTLLFHATTGAETLHGVATHPAQPGTVWVLCRNGSSSIVKAFTATSGTLQSSWSSPIANGNDLTVDPVNGIIWLVADSDGDVHALDINSGTELLAGTYRTFASGFGSPAGLSVTGGLAYVIDAVGNVRFLFVADGGDLAGTLATGTTAAGMLTDVDGGEVWIIRPSGDLSVFRAHVAVATIGAAGAVEGAPGFDNIVAGQFVHVIMQSDKAASPHPRNKLLFVYAKGQYVTRTIPTSPGQPDEIQRAWVSDGGHHAVLTKDKVHAISNEIICQGEESRVDDWSPKDDGYGVFGTEVVKTAQGHYVRYSKRWRLADWDVPPRTFEIDPPEWTNGLAYLMQYLAIKNSERAIQVLKVTNRNGLFRRLVLGGEYTVQKTLDGPPGGLTGVLRLLAYTPDEGQGEAELIGEWVA